MPEPKKQPRRAARRLDAEAPRRPRPLKVDFGFFVTLKLALSGFAGSFGRLLAWTALALVSAGVVCALPILLGLANYHRYTVAAWQGLAGGSIALIGMLVLVVSWVFLLTPAGGAVLVDQRLRGDELGAGEALGRAALAVLLRAGSLAAIFAVYLALVTLFLLPGLAVCYGLFLVSGGNLTLPALFLYGVIGLGLVLLVATLGLAVPICLLEEAPASEALARSWALSSQGLGAMTGLSALYVGVGVLIHAPFEAIGLAGLGSLLSFGVVSLFLPALLVAAYHGLAAEDADVLGRG
ncbi:MAG: hypothetical protein AB7N76_00705 [Planctomycetota bacterium]